jgi:CheY-specific phosphatase CheX
MCFTAAQPSAELTVSQDELTAKQIHFTGDALGQLCVAMDHTTARRMAANFYGDDADTLDEVQVESLVAELTNVVCGGMLSLFARDGSFALSPPETVEPSAILLRKTKQCFVTDCGAVMVTVACG